MWQSALDIDAMRLITLRAGNFGKFDPQSFLSIFDPFDGMVWLTTVGMFIMGAIFMWVTEGDRDSDDYKHTHRYVRFLVLTSTRTCVYMHKVRVHIRAHKLRYVFTCIHMNACMSVAIVSISTGRVVSYMKHSHVL